MDRTLDVAQNSMTNLQKFIFHFFLAYIAAKIPGDKIAAGSPFLGFIPFLFLKFELWDPTRYVIPPFKYFHKYAGCREGGPEAKRSKNLTT
jgi:hypothetical protein